MTIEQHNRIATYSKGNGSEEPCRVCGIAWPKGTPHRSKATAYYLFRRVNIFRGDDELIDTLCPEHYAIKSNRLPNAL